ncbi:MAG: Ribose transport system permease protein RbsC [Spirochaetes bacterium ADurb.Bin110]|nr:MAG: Ribose transport system permease protein RbsC [Spirochaetes bacterium ADurb.Bin110]
MNALLSSIRYFAKKNGSFLIFLILAIIASIAVPNFFALDNFAIIIKQSAIPLIACIGMTLVLMTGGIDLSMGYIVGFASITSGLLAKIYQWPIPAVVLATFIVGIAFGSLNGFIIQFMKVPAFITTLGSGYIIYGLAQIVSQGSIVSRLPEGFLAIGRTEMLGLPSSVFIAAVVLLIFYIIINKGIFGRSLRAFGYNAKAAEVSGVPISKINVSVYIASGLLAALAGMLFTIRVNAAQPNMGGGNFNFEVITAAIVGGTSLFGGVGSITGTLFGVLSIKIIENCINLMGISYHLYMAVQGVIILIAIIFENVKNKAL